MVGGWKAGREMGRKQRGKGEKENKRGEKKREEESFEKKMNFFVSLVPEYTSLISKLQNITQSKSLGRCKMNEVDNNVSCKPVKHKFCWFR